MSHSETDATTAASTSRRQAFSDAAAAFVACVETIADEEWAQRATDHWTVRELVAHTSRSFSTVLDFEAPIGTAIDVASPHDFLVTALATRDVHVGVAERARETALKLGDHVVERLQEFARLAVEQAARLDDDAPIHTFVGVMRYIDFILTRTSELTLHLADLQLALRRPVTLPASAVAVLQPYLVAAIERLDPTAALLGLTGRGPLNVYG